MTEAEWLACADTLPMLDFLRGQSTQRKFRLLLSACCRRAWDRNTPRAVKAVVEAAEQYADGIISWESLRTVGQATEEVRSQVQNHASWLAGWALCPNAREAADAMERSTRKKERRPHAALLHDVIGDPFRTIRADVAWQAWSGGTVIQLAEAAYTERAFDRLPILADALEDAGCENVDILQHCRGPGPHAKGCWVLDLLLQKS